MTRETVEMCSIVRQGYVSACLDAEMSAPQTKKEHLGCYQGQVQ